jgi:cell division protein FtsB
LKKGWKIWEWVNGPARAVSVAVLILLVALFGREIVASLRVRAEIAELERQKRELVRSIEADSVLLRRLDDPEFLERYARERYLMRKQHETVYIIEE